MGAEAQQPGPKTPQPAKGLRPQSHNPAEPLCISKHSLSSSKPSVSRSIPRFTRFTRVEELDKIILSYVKLRLVECIRESVYEILSEVPSSDSEGDALAHVETTARRIALATEKIALRELLDVVPTEVEKKAPGHEAPMTEGAGRTARPSKAAQQCSAARSELLRLGSDHFQVPLQKRRGRPPKRHSTKPNRK